MGAQPSSSSVGRGGASEGRGGAVSSGRGGAFTGSLLASSYSPSSRSAGSGGGDFDSSTVLDCSAVSGSFGDSSRGFREADDGSAFSAILLEWDRCATNG